MKTKRIYLASLFVVSIGVFVPVFLFAPKISAATFVVDSVSDDSDSAWGDSVCDNGLGECTLRAALEESNSLDGDDIVNFAISGVGPHTISPSSSLPTISEAILIDATTQPGTTCGDLVPASIPAGSNTPHNLMIYLNGLSVTTASGFKVDAQSGEVGVVELRGMAIGGFTDSNGINADDVYADDDVNLEVDCMYMGTNVDGMTAVANATGIASSIPTTITNTLLSGNARGINIFNDSLSIEGSIIGLALDGEAVLSNQNEGIYAQASEVLASNNIISANHGAGIGGSDMGLTLTGSFIGLTLSGDAAGNAGHGIETEGSPGIYINGATKHNIISANQGDGVHIFNNCGGNNDVDEGILVGNYIGTNVSGLVIDGFGNGGSGVRIDEWNGFCASVENVQVGGVNVADENIIAGNTEDGVRVHQTTSTNVHEITIIGNSIFGNGQLGIDLAHDDDADGVADTDIGFNPINDLLLSYPATKANYFLNAPQIHSAITSNNQITVNYSYHAQAVQDSDPEINASDVIGYRLDFYRDDTVKTGNMTDQAKYHIGSFIIDGSEVNATHTFTVPAALSGRQAVTATATVLWKDIPNPCDGVSRYGNKPPYQAGAICD